MTTVTDSPSGHPLVEELFAETERRMLSNYELAHELGVSPKTVLFWRRGVKPQLRHQRAIIAWLGNGSPPVMPPPGRD